MEKEAEKKFLEIKELFNRMREEMCVIVASYYIWDTLVFAGSISEVGREQAGKNIRLTEDLYINFFIPTKQSHLQTVIIGLMKFFDKDHQAALSIENLIKKIIKNKDIFTLEIFKNLHPKLDEIGAIKNEYSPIDKNTIDYIKQLQKKYESIKNDLQTCRDKQLAHTDIKIPKKLIFVPNELEAFIGSVQEMFNKLSSNFDLSSTIWDSIKDSSIRDTNFLLENLNRGEIQRREEIQKRV